MDREQILYAAGATMLMCIVALLLFFIGRFCMKIHRKNALVNMALEVLDDVFQRIVKINYRTAECVFIRDKSEKKAVPFETYDWYEFRDSFLESVYPEDQEKVRTFTSLAHMRRVRESVQVSDTCIYKRRQWTPEYQWMQTVIIPAKEPDCVMVYARNVDESVRAEELYKEQLWEVLQRTRDAEISKTEFLRYICHDLRIPMNEIIELNTLAREMIEKEELRQAGHCLTHVESLGNYMLTMLDDMIQIGIYREWRVKFSKAPFSLREILRNCQNYCRNVDAAPAQISFHMELDEELEERYNGDGSRLAQLLNALLSNAYKYNRKGGSVLLKAWRIEAGENRDEVAVSVRDTGCGIGDELLTAIRSLFAQNGSIRDRVRDDIGLGLLFVKRTLDAMGGRIEAESKVDEGSCFTLYFQLEHVKNALQQGECPEQEKKEDLKILVVDDNELHLEMASEMLAVNNFPSVSCGSGEQALKVFRESAPGTFGVVLTDLEMPEMDGHQLASEIRRSEHVDGKKIQIIALTIHDNDEERRKALNSGMNEFLTKPFQVGEFKQVLEKLLA